MTTAEIIYMARQAQWLSERGWKFRREVGPLGTFYVGRAVGMTIQSEPCQDEREALVTALNHAAKRSRRG